MAKQDATKATQQSVTMGIDITKEAVNVQTFGQPTNGRNEDGRPYCGKHNALMVAGPEDAAEAARQADAVALILAEELGDGFDAAASAAAFKALALQYQQLP